MLIKERVDIIKTELKRYFKVGDFSGPENFIILDIKEKYWSRVHTIFESNINYLNRQTKGVFQLEYEEMGSFIMKLNPKSRSMKEFKIAILQVKMLLDNVVGR